MGGSGEGEVEEAGGVLVDIMGVKEAGGGWKVEVEVGAREQEINKKSETRKIKNEKIEKIKR